MAWSLLVNRLVHLSALIALFPRVVRILRRTSNARRAASFLCLTGKYINSKPAELARITCIVDFYARMLRATCLQRSLAICELSHEAGIPLRLVIGIRRTETGIKAHAWTAFDEIRGEENEYEELEHREEQLPWRI